MGREDPKQVEAVIAQIHGHNMAMLRDRTPFKDMPINYQLGIDALAKHILDALDRVRRETAKDKPCRKTQ